MKVPGAGLTPRRLNWNRQLLILAKAAGKHLVRRLRHEARNAPERVATKETSSQAGRRTTSHWHEAQGRFLSCLRTGKTPLRSPRPSGMCGDSQVPGTRDELWQGVQIISGQLPRSRTGRPPLVRPWSVAAAHGMRATVGQRCSSAAWKSAVGGKIWCFSNHLLRRELQRCFLGIAARCGVPQLSALVLTRHAIFTRAKILSWHSGLGPVRLFSYLSS